MISRVEVLQEYDDNLINGKILGFFKAHRALSNFHVEQFKWRGITWPASENAYQAAKELNAPKETLRDFATMTPGEAKTAGRALVLQPGWEGMKVGVMEEILRAKFTQCTYARGVLLMTNTGHLEECNWWGDRFWGTVNGVGQNQLGKLLMQVRDELNAPAKALAAAGDDIET